MHTASKQIEDLVILSAHQNELYKNQLNAKYLLLFGKVLKKIDNVVKSSYNQADTTLRAKKILNARLKTILTTDLVELKNKLLIELQTFSTSSAALYTDQLDAVFEPVSEYTTVTAAKSETVVKGFNNDYLNFEKNSHTVDSMWDIFVANLTRNVYSTTDQAFALELSEEEYEDNLTGVAGSTAQSKNHLKTVIATLVTFGFNTALKYTNKANTKLVSGYLWQSVMDSATTDICTFLDGRYWLYSQPEKSTLPYQIIPAAHHGCRSMVVAIIKSYKELGIDPTDLSASQKILLSGEIPEKVTYTQFVNGLPVRVQKEVLGKVRYDMYKSGEITLDKFYTKDGRRLSLSELQSSGYKISSQYLQYVRKT